LTGHTILIADDHPLVRGALREAVSSILSSVSVIEAGSFDELVAAFKGGTDIDLVLLDLTMPGVQGFSGLLFCAPHIRKRLLLLYRAMKIVRSSVAASSWEPQAICRNHSIRMP